MPGEEHAAAFWVSGLTCIGVLVLVVLAVVGAMRVFQAVWGGFQPSFVDDDGVQCEDREDCQEERSFVAWEKQVSSARVRRRVKRMRQAGPVPQDKE